MIWIKTNNNNNKEAHIVSSDVGRGIESVVNTNKLDTTTDALNSGLFESETVIPKPLLAITIAFRLQNPLHF